MRGLDKNVSDSADRQTDRQTDGHRDLETESAQWADSVKKKVLSFPLLAIRSYLILSLIHKTAI